MDKDIDIDLHLMLSDAEYKALVESVMNSAEASEKFISTLRLVRDKAREEMAEQSQALDTLNRLLEKLKRRSYN